MKRRLTACAAPVHVGTGFDQGGGDGTRVAVEGSEMERRERGEWRGSSANMLLLDGLNGNIALSLNSFLFEFFDH